MFPDELKILIENQKYANLFANSQGVMIGNGEIWFSEVCKDKNCNERVVKITANNYTAASGSKKTAADVSKSTSSISRQFHGIWGRSLKECKMLLKEGTDFAGATVTEKEVNRPEFFCKVVSLTNSSNDERKISGTFKCNSPEGNSTQKITMELQFGKLKVNSDEILVHCN